MHNFKPKSNTDTNTNIKAGLKLVSAFLVASAANISRCQNDGTNNQSGVPSHLPSLQPTINCANLVDF